VVVVIEAEIDDMNPQIFGVLMDRLLATGARRVLHADSDEEEPPGTLCTLSRRRAARDADRDDVSREHDDWRPLPRDAARVPRPRERCIDTPLGPVRVKVAAATASS
jgi:uncharacterized protein (DUF111 family)